MKLNIQRFAATPPTSGNLIDEDCLYEYHQNVESNFAKKNADNDFKSLVVDSIRSKNMFDKNAVIDGYRFGSDGALFGDSSYSASGYIEVKPSTTYTISRTGTAGSACICLYNSSKGFISRTFFQGDATINITTTSVTYYVRIAELTTNIGNLMLESGSTASTYVPGQNLTGQIITGTNLGTVASGCSGSLPYIKIGNVVFLSVMDYKATSNITTHDTLLGSNLPKATTAIVFISYRRDLGAAVRMRITTSGELRLHYSQFAASTNEIYGMVVYTSSD